MGYWTFSGISFLNIERFDHLNSVSLARFTSNATINTTLGRTRRLSTHQPAPPNYAWSSLLPLPITNYHLHPRLHDLLWING